MNLDIIQHKKKKSVRASRAIKRSHYVRFLCSALHFRSVVPPSASVHRFTRSLPAFGSFLHLFDFVVLLRYATPFLRKNICPLAVFRRLLFLHSVRSMVRLRLTFLFFLAPTCYGSEASSPISTSLQVLLYFLVPRHSFPPLCFIPFTATPPCATRKKKSLFIS